MHTDETGTRERRRVAHPGTHVTFQGWSKADSTFKGSREVSEELCIYKKGLDQSCFTGRVQGCARQSAGFRPQPVTDKGLRACRPLTDGNVQGRHSEAQVPAPAAPPSSPSPSPSSWTPLSHILSLCHPPGKSCNCTSSCWNDPSPITGLPNSSASRLSPFSQRRMQSSCQALLHLAPGPFLKLLPILFSLLTSLLYPPGPKGSLHHASYSAVTRAFALVFPSAKMFFPQVTAHFTPLPP